MQEAEIQAIVQAVLAEINKRQGTNNGATQTTAVSSSNELHIDLPDPTEEAALDSFASTPPSEPGRTVISAPSLWSREDSQ